MSVDRRKLLLGGTALAGATVAGGWSVRRRTSASASRKLEVSREDSVPEAEPGSALDFFVTGDTGSDSDVRKQVVAAMSRKAGMVKPRFLVLTGDNFYPHGVTSVDDPAWRVHFEDAFDARGLDIPFYPCLGNHDHEGNVDAQLEYSQVNRRWRLPASYDTFRQDVDGRTAAEFFVLDTMPLRQRSLVLGMPDQVDWLEQALAGSKAGWKIAIGHHPIHAGTAPGGSSKVNWHVGPLFARGGVDLYFSGHNHDLELIDPDRGWLQVISGAGSSPRKAGPIDGTLFFAEGGGFVRVSLRARAAWIEFVQPAAGTVAVFRVERRALG